MSKNDLGFITVASALSIASFSFSIHPSSAQNAIAPDNTLPVNTSVNFNIANKTYTIRGGTQVGVNQFHSFQDFSVPTGNTAHFDTLPTTVNTISRVTGANISNIDGLIKANGTTNLYLINPNGIVFGKDAKLDIGGSFSASTANSVKFPDGSEFSATNPQAPPLLSVNVPLGLQYGKSNVGATISDRGNLAAGQDLVLNADKLDLQGSLQAGRNLTLQAQDLVKISDTVANPFVANSGRDLTIQGNNSVDIFALNNPLTQILSGRHLGLVSDGVISGDARFLSGGNLSFLTTDGELANFVSNYAAIIYANGDVTFGNYTGAALKVEATGSIQTGGIRITSPDTSGAISISDPDFETLTTLPSVILRAGVTSVAANMPQTTVSNTFSSTTLGDSAGSITFGSIDTSSSTGDGGAIELTAKGDIKANFGFLNSSSSLESGSLGNGGAISFSTINGDISLPNSFLVANSFSVFGSSGNGGAISFSTINGDISLPDSILSATSISVSESGNSGNGGAISFSTINGDISLSKSILTANSSTTINSVSGNTGNGGAISLSTINGHISLPNSFLFSTSVSFSFTGNSGNGGAISLSTNTGNISLPNSLLFSYSILNSLSNSDTGNSGNGGAISLSTINGDISLPNSSLVSTSVSFSKSDSGNSGNGGAISLSTINGNISLKSLELNADSGNSGNGGENPSIDIPEDIPEEIILNASELNSYSYSVSGNSGNGGDIILSAIKGNILGAGSTSTSIYSFSVANTPNSTSGAGGNVNLDAKNLINNFEFVTASSSGIAGNATINGFGDLTISSLQISTSKTVSIRDLRDSDQIIILDLGTRGSSGDATVAGSGSLIFDNTIVNSTTQGINPAGTISITSPSLITFQNNSQIKSSTESTGSAGNIFFTAPILDIMGETQILAETNGDGAGGNIEIDASNAVNLMQTVDSFPVLSVQTNSRGKAGTILINTPTVTLSDQARITATATKESTNEEGGGSVTLNASTMNLSGTVGVFAETESSANAGTLKLSPYGADSDLKINLTSGAKISASTSSSGNGGNIELSAPQSISIIGSGEISVTTSNIGNAGSISFNAPNILLKDGVFVSASTSGTGRGGDITLGISDTTNNTVKNTVSNVTLSNGARIDTSTSSSGDSGKIEIIAGNSFILDGNNTGLFARTEENSTGNGGGIFIDPPLVSITNGAGISVDSLGKGNGGDLAIFAGKFVFANNAFLRANTASGEGGNINLQITDIFFPRNNSSINATAGGNGNGGNINLSALFAIAIPSENSDIFANASFGKGGNINLTTQGLFGFAFRPRLTPLSDITASSDFGLQGNVNINTLGVDPSKGLNNLPSNVGDASRLVKQECIADRRGSSFTIAGKGGIAAKPSDRPTDIGALDNFGSLPDRNQTANITSIATSENNSIPERIVEATGWIVNAQQQVVLIAGKSPAQANIPCYPTKHQQASITK